MVRKGSGQPDGEPPRHGTPPCGCRGWCQAGDLGHGPHIGLMEAVDRAVSWDADRCRLSPGGRIGALLVNLLAEREPLYHVEEAFALVDPTFVLGQGITAADLGDDAFGRATWNATMAAEWESWPGEPESSSTPASIEWRRTMWPEAAFVPGFRRCRCRDRRSLCDELRKMGAETALWRSRPSKSCSAAFLSPNMLH